MKKILVILTVIIIGIGACNMMNSGPSKEEMIEVLKSDEARIIIIKDLKKRDINALEEYGIIKSYEVDYNSVKWNPMGGITFFTYINNDKDLYIVSTLLKEADKLKRDGGSISTKLDNLLKETPNANL